MWKKTALINCYANHSGIYRVFFTYRMSRPPTGLSGRKDQRYVYLTYITNIGERIYEQT